MGVVNTEKLDMSVNAETVSVKKFAEALNLETIFEGRGSVTLNSISVSRPGLQLTGYFKHFDHNRVQLIGNAEHEYLLSMAKKDRDKNLDELFKRDIPCIIVANNLEMLNSLLTYAKKYNCPVFLSKQITTPLVLISIFFCIFAFIYNQ